MQRLPEWTSDIANYKAKDFPQQDCAIQHEGLSPPARVYKQRLPEWTSDIANYKAKDFPQQDCAIRCNLHGYLALPVSDPTTGLCVGVLELLTFSKLEDFTHEVEHIHQALKEETLTTRQAFEGFYGPALNVSNEHSKNESDKISGILKHVCDAHRLPLAQTWIVSPCTSYSAHEKVIKKSCNSFNTTCLGKVCLSTASPYYVGDVNVWSFIKASKKRHLERSRGVVGRAMPSRGSCFCEDVTQLDKEEYPLVHNARISKLTGCLAIFLHSVEDNNDYVLEFFLHINNSIHVMNLVHTLKQSIEADSGFELGDVSTMEIIGPPMHLSLNETGSSDSNSIVTDAFETNHGSASMETVCDNFTGMVTVNVTFNNDKKSFEFSLFSGVPELEKKVAKMFKLDGQAFKLEYVDEDNDLIRVCVNKDLESAWFASGGNNSMNLKCSEIT
ncbi:protein NLP6-like [Bidens hawaiensis]|uniref:protein NLP6-like n=1 Tax=Bidens hawaiensis TaxID=980011 RepID=UPI00404B7A0B